MKRVWLIALILIALVAVSTFLYFRMQPEPQPDQLIYGSGRIEADEIRIAPEVAGRLLEVRGREGEKVTKGELLAQIDPIDFELQASQALAQQTATRRSATQIDGLIELYSHHAMTARADLRRYEALRAKGWVTAPQVDQRRNAYVAAAGQVRVLRQQRAEADAQVDAAGKTLSLARQRVGRARLYAPISGSILSRLAEPGEVVAVGQPVTVLANLERVRLKMFVSEADLGRLRLGAPARIRVDAFPDRTFPARIARVDAQAQFTPRDVHMKDERVRTVYGVTLEAPNPDGLLKPGMPADAWVLWDESRSWPARLTIPE